MTKIKEFLQFVKDELIIESGALDPEEKVIFHLSNKILKKLLPLVNEYNVAKIFYNLKDGVQRKFLVGTPVDYINVDDEGNISFLKPRWFDEQDKWKTTRRDKMKVTKVLKDIYDQAYINSYIKQSDIESFINKWSLEFKEQVAHIEDLKGEDILRAYHYTQECNKNFGYTCANFFQRYNKWGNHDEPTREKYDIYIKNPDKCGVIVVIDNGEIVARRTYQYGPQVVNSGSFKKGQIYTIWGNYYGVGGEGSKYDIMIKDYIKKTFPNADYMGNRDGSFIIDFETRFRNYCSFDSMYVCFKFNLLSDTFNEHPDKYDNYEWNNTYNASCPQILVDQRIEEEEAKKLIKNQKIE